MSVIYTFATDAVTARIEASSLELAALRFAESEGIPALDLPALCDWFTKAGGWLRISRDGVPMITVV